MADLTHLWKIGQKVVWVVDEWDTVTPLRYKGTIKEVYPDHVIVDIPDVCDGCFFEQGFNMDTLYPEYDFA